MVAHHSRCEPFSFDCQDTARDFDTGRHLVVGFAHSQRRALLNLAELIGRR
jgi:hypothetical protein